MPLLGSDTTDGQLDSKFMGAVRLGYGNKDNQFVLGPEIATINPEKMNKAGSTDAQWYVYKAERVGKNIFVQIVDKFLSADVHADQYDSYDLP